MKSPLPPRPPNPLNRKLAIDTLPENVMVGVLDSGVQVIVRMRPVNKEEEQGETKVNSCEGLIGMGEGKENVHELSVPSDIPVVDHAKVMLRDFKDYKGLKFLQSSSEVTKASASEMNVLEDNLPLEGRMPMVKNLSGEGKSDDHQQILNQVNPMIASLDANAVSMNDSGHHEKAIAQMAANLPDFLVNPATNLHEIDEAGDHEKAKVEKCDVAGVASRGQSAEGKHSLQTQTTFESGSILHESVVGAGDVVNVSETKLPETKFTNLDGVSTTPAVIKQLEIDGNDKTQGECVAEHGRDVEILDRNSEDHTMKDSLVSPSDTEMLSTQSDTPAVVDSETLPSTDNPASKEAEETNSKKPEGVTERQLSEKSDVFEAPSFMTLVEPGGGVHHKGSASAIQITQNPQQQKVLSSEAGWFPSLTNVVNESQGRKKNEEIIAKVTNWSAGKQHTPLKNLLSEANLETKPKPPNPRDNKTPVVQKDKVLGKGILCILIDRLLSLKEFKIVGC
ncbi:hypothetical protein Pint_20863 [Pistacia integerrima]|uniref:Uncharacterized protein n=1 Tax=Pistacia integerrima TaxID=434235 RepID=A0ACC0XE85_9ROSI|nr:hypothetical protein Pint_20863 [Pistacia integerrima]